MRFYLSGVTIWTALEHVKQIVGFQRLVFYWPHHERTLWTEFQRIQQAAGIHLACPDAAKHKCTPACHRYGFHALRRGYAHPERRQYAGPGTSAEDATQELHNHPAVHRIERQDEEGNGPSVRARFPPKTESQLSVIGVLGGSGQTPTPLASTQVFSSNGVTEHARQDSNLQPAD